MSSTRRLFVAASVTALSLTLAGCGSDDADSADGPASSSSASTSESPESPPPASTEAPTGEETAACTSLLELQRTLAGIGGEKPNKKTLLNVQGLMTAIAAGTEGEPSASAQSAVDTISEALDTNNMKLLDTDEFFGTLISPASAGRDCGFTPLDISIEEMPAATKADNPMYHYTGLPEGFAPGTYSIGMTSQSKAFHEAIVVKLKDSYTGTKDQLLELPDPKMFAQFDGAPTVGYVPPDSTGFVNADLSAPGRYLVFCHIPLEGKGGKLVMGARGPIWHFLIGMAEEVTVG